MRLSAHILWILLPLAACGTTQPKKSHPYAQPNDLMAKEIKQRVENIAYQHNQELLNNMVWLAGKAGETAIPALLDGLRHKNAKVRASCCWVLGRIRDRRTIPNLQPLAKDQNEAVRFEAARSLVVMGDLKFSPLLIEGLDSQHTRVRYNCHMALKDATSRDFQYDHLEETERERRLAVLRWRQWYSDYSQDPWFAERYAQTHGLSEQTNKGVPAAPGGETKPTGEQRNTAPTQPEKKGGEQTQGGTETPQPIPVVIPDETGETGKTGGSETTEKK